MKRILVVDDEKNMCAALKILLENDGYSVITSSNGREAINYLTKGEVIDLIISDLKMPDIDGMGILNFLKETDTNIPLVLITAYGSIEVAVDAMKKGAEDFITKPFNKDVIRHIIRRIFRIETLENENKRLKDIIKKGKLVYKSKAMQDIMNTVKKIVSVSTPVLIMGESGSGKGLIAEAIHSFGCDRAGTGCNKPFIRINCPAIPETLLESELFGYRKGAFTGATRDFKGKVRFADGGTLFLDEIADFPKNIQPKLLRLLEEKTFESLGSNNTIKINTRIICTTNRDMKALVKEGLFREDLFYRINAITIYIPPLRDRQEDIMALSEFFLDKYAREMGKNITGFSNEVRKALTAYPWPGNIRELRNLVERAVVLSSSEVIKLSDLPMEFQRVNIKVHNPENKLETTEINLLLDALHRSNGNISAAAKELGISRSTLRYRMKKHMLKNG